MDSSKGLPAVSLLNSYMDIILSASRKQIITLTCISKGVWEERSSSFSDVELRCHCHPSTGSLLRAETDTKIVRAWSDQTCSLLALLEQVSPGRPAFPAWEKAWASCPRPALGSRSRVGGSQGRPAAPHPADATGRNPSSKAGPHFPPHWRARVSLRLAPPLPPDTVTTAVTYRT